MKAIVRALVRWYWLLVLCLLLGGLGGIVLAAVFPPTYQVTAIVQLNALTNNSQIIQPVAVYAALATSDPVMAPLLKKYPNIARQMVLARQLVVTSDASSQTISIQVTLSNPNTAVDIANTLAQSLIEQQNAYIKSQYDTELQLVKGRIADEQKTINHPNQQLSNQVAEQQNLQNQDISTEQSLELEQALNSAPLSIIQSATVPSKPSTIISLVPLPLPVALIALIGGLVAISFLEQSTGRINGVYELQQKTALPVLGSLRWTSPAPQSVPIYILGEAKTPYSEDCRVMMADVLSHTAGAQARVLAITGLKSQSGMSTIAAQLAYLLAQSKRRVLLIDANLSEPSLHNRFEIRNQAGLAKVLEEYRLVKQPATNGLIQAPLKIEERPPVHNYILPTKLQNLYLLPAGSPVLNPYSLLSMPEIAQFFHWASKSIDFIIIDCPDLTCAEAYVLGSLADQTFLVVDATRDQVKQVVNAKEKLLNTGVKVSGLIVNKLERWI